MNLRHSNHLGHRLTESPAVAAGLAALALASAFAVPASAAPIAVNDYNWLDLRPDSVTPIVGSTTNVGGSGYGEPADYRWGDHVWIPDGALTGDGSADYFAALQFDQPREVETVTPQWWANEGTSIRRFSVEGTTPTRLITESNERTLGRPPPQLLAAPPARRRLHRPHRHHLRPSHHVLSRWLEAQGRQATWTN